MLVGFILRPGHLNNCKVWYWDDGEDGSLKEKPFSSYTIRMSGCLIGKHPTRDTKDMLEPPRNQVGPCAGVDIADLVFELE
jgi:hypothetical protein